MTVAVHQASTSVLQHNKGNAKMKNAAYIVVEPGLTYLVEGQKLTAKQYSIEAMYFGEDAFTVRKL